MGGVLVRIPEPTVQELLPLPHLAWADLGEERAAALAGGARSLVLRFWSIAGAPLPDRGATEGYVSRHAALVAETFHYLGRASSSARAALEGWTERMYVALDRHGDHAPQADPFRGLSEAADPPGHLDPGSAPAWAFLMGGLVRAAERDLGWRARRGRIDLRTWGTLVGLSYLWSRRSFAAARPALRDFLEAAGLLELNRDGLLAGGALLVNQRAVVAGYLDARRRAGR
jgi:hypothetical protein